MNHTPGPWSIRTQNAGTAIQAEGRGLCGRPKRVARVACDRAAMFVGEPEANARLISAAPELLEACKATLRLLRENGHTHDAPKQAADYDILDQFDTGLSSPISAVLEAAIAKAEGRTQ